MGGMATTPGRLVYRPIAGRVLTGCFAGFAAWWVIAGLVGNARASVSWTGIAWLLAVGAVMYAVLWRPAVVVDAEGVRLLNVLRDVRIPWAALESVETRYTLTLITAGRSYASWAAGAPGRGSAMTRVGHGRAGEARAGQDPRTSAPGGTVFGARTRTDGVMGVALPRPGWLPGDLNPDRASRDLRSDSGAAAFMVEQGWLGWRDRPGARAEAGAPVPPVGVRWNVPVAVGVPVVVAVAVLAGALCS
jgi:hypothetical protein